jgi:hypothetical protein
VIENAPKSTPVNFPATTLAEVFDHDRVPTP